MMHRTSLRLLLVSFALVTSFLPQTPALADAISTVDSTGDSSASALAAEDVSIRPVADGFIVDSDFDRGGDLVVDGLNSVVVGFNAHFGPGEYRGIYEFDLRQLPSCNGDLEVTLRLSLVGSAFEGTDPNLTLYAGPGDGALAVADFASGVLVTGFSAFDAAPFNDLDVTSAVRGLLGAGEQFVAFVVRPNPAAATGRGAFLYSSNEISDTFDFLPTVLATTCVGPTGIEVTKTASQQGGFVSGAIQIMNDGDNPAIISGMADALEVRFPANVTPPALSPGSAPNWFKVADVPVPVPRDIPVGETATIPYIYDLCAAADFTGANAMRNVVAVTLENKPKHATATVVTRSDGFKPVRPDCPDLWIEKVDQVGAAVEGITLEVTFPDGSMRTCVTDATGRCHFGDIPVGTYIVDESLSEDFVLLGCDPDQDPSTVAGDVTLAHGDEVTVTCTNMSRLVPSTPVLLTPIGNASIQQNDPTIGCPFYPSRGYGFRIFFDWTDSSSQVGIAGYEIFAERESALVPIVDAFVTDSQLTVVSCNTFVIDQNLEGWRWRVRARDNSGNLGEWTAFAQFRFAPCRIEGTPCSA
jgi:hypothetical protein